MQEETILQVLPKSKAILENNKEADIKPYSFYFFYKFLAMLSVSLLRKITFRISGHHIDIRTRKCPIRNRKKNTDFIRCDCRLGVATVQWARLRYKKLFRSSNFNCNRYFIVIHYTYFRELPIFPNCFYAKLLGLSVQSCYTFLPHQA